MVQVVAYLVIKGSGGRDEDRVLVVSASRPRVNPQRGRVRTPEMSENVNMSEGLMV